MERNARRWTRAAEAGSALMIAMMVSVILTLLGLSYLVLADQENRIAVNQRDSDQLLFVAEAGAKMVKAWFDRPVHGDPNAPLFKFMGDYDLRRTLYYDRTQRLFDHDADPNTAEVLADGTAGRPYFRQGMTVSGDPNFLTFWEKPYRGSNAAEFKGLESGPDIVMESDNIGPGALDTFNLRVIGDRTAQEKVGRIQKIEVYAPPIIEIGGVRTRYGIATVKVTASKFKRMSQSGIVPVTTAASVEVARRVVRMVLNETPYPGPTGPFQSCVDFQTNGNVQVHWGEVAAGGSAQIGPGTAQLHANTPPSIPYATVNRFVSGTTLANWVQKNNGQTGTTSSSLWFDPWYRFRAGGAIANTGTMNNQPFPFPDPNCTAASCPVIEDASANDETNIFQYAPPQCPDFDYQTWKNVAVSGGQNIHYMVYAGSADSWKEDGMGVAQSLQAWTNGKEGFWFFDTIDRLHPDPNGTNLAPKISVSGNWTSAGFIYLNADWDSSGMAASGANRVIIPPGEPWVDADGDKVVDPGEYVNLMYPTTLTGQFRVYVPGDAGNPAQTATVTSTNGVTYSYTTDPNGRDTQGVPFTGSIAYQGVVYTSGRFEATGNLTVFGSVVTKRGMHDSGAGPTAGTPFVLFDERLIKGDWPPPELELPRTTITFWSTEM